MRDKNSGRRGKDLGVVSSESDVMSQRFFLRNGKTGYRITFEPPQLLCLARDRESD